VGIVEVVERSQRDKTLAARAHRRTWLTVW
jgi:hypothetical protein